MKTITALKSDIEGAKRRRRAIIGGIYVEERNLLHYSSSSQTLRLVTRSLMTSTRWLDDLDTNYLGCRGDEKNRLVIPHAGFGGLFIDSCLQGPSVVKMVTFFCLSRIWKSPRNGQDFAGVLNRKRCNLFAIYSGRRVPVGCRGTQTWTMGWFCVTVYLSAILTSNRRYIIGLTLHSLQAFDADEFRITFYFILYVRSKIK